MLGNGPEPPDEFAALRIVRCHKPADAVVAARCSDDDFVVDYQRSAGGAVVAVPTGIGNIPDQISGARVQAEQVRVVSLSINPIMPDCNPAADMARGVIN